MPKNVKQEVEPTKSEEQNVGEGVIWPTQQPTSEEINISSPLRKKALDFKKQESSGK